MFIFLLKDSFTEQYGVGAGFHDFSGSGPVGAPSELSENTLMKV